MSIVTPYENRTNTDNSHNMFLTRRRLSCYTSPSLMFSFTNTSTFFLQTRRHYLCPAHREVDPLNLPILIYPASGIHASSGGLLISRQWHTYLFWRQPLLISRQWHTCLFWRQPLFISRQWHTCLFWRLTYTILRQRPWPYLTSDSRDIYLKSEDSHVVRKSYQYS